MDEDRHLISMAQFFENFFIEGSADPDEPIQGLTSQTFTFTGIWDYQPLPLPKCGVCGEEFAEGPEGIATLTDPKTGFSVHACPQCAMAFIAVED